MRIYEGSPRQDFEEVLRSIGAFLDQRNMREVLVLEAPDGFIVQGLVTSGATGGSWSESMGVESKETLTFLDDDIARFMEEAVARRGRPGPGEPTSAGGRYEHAFRVIGRYLDERKPNDIFFFEQGGAFVVRVLTATQTGKRHELVEFTADDVTSLVAHGPNLRAKETTTGLSSLSGVSTPGQAPPSGTAPTG
jgi:hypothetical protein